MIIVMCAPHIKTKLSMPQIKLCDTVVPVCTVAKNIGVFFENRTTRYSTFAV